MKKITSNFLIDDDEETCVQAYKQFNTKNIYLNDDLAEFLNMLKKQRELKFMNLYCIENVVKTKQDIILKIPQYVTKR